MRRLRQLLSAQYSVAYAAAAAARRRKLQQIKAQTQNMRTLLEGIGRHLCNPRLPQ
jgi:hypothetical protein